MKDLGPTKAILWSHFSPTHPFLSAPNQCKMNRQPDLTLFMCHILFSD